MDVIVPFAVHDPKTRLSDVLDRRERNAFARAMLGDVLEAVDAAGATPHVLATRPLDRIRDPGSAPGPGFDPDSGFDPAPGSAPAPGPVPGSDPESDPAPDPDSGPPLDVDVIVDERDLTPAVNAALASSFDDPAAFGPPIAVVMSDLPLATPGSVRRLLETRGEVVLAPGRAGGTNALVVRHPSFRVDYHGASIRDHRRAARSLGVDLGEVDSRRLASDVDDRDDLVEVLVHGDGRSREWLVDAGFELSVDGGEIEAVRTEERG